MLPHRRPSWLLAATLGALVLLLVGWLLGDWAACAGSKCSFDTALFDALGTWVGGLGTIAALVFAAVQLSADFEERARERQREEDRARQALEVAFEEAQSIEVRATMIMMEPTEVGRLLKVIVRNEANETPVFNVHVTVPNFGGFVVPRIDAKSSDRHNFSLRDDSDLPEVRLRDGQSWETWAVEFVDTISIEFDMNGSSWRRKANGLARQVGPSRV